MGIKDNAKSDFISQHTKGPWHVGVGNGEGSIFADNGRLKYEDGTVLYSICQVTKGFNEEEDQANANLIAAAPDLFDLADTVVSGNTEYSVLQDMAKQLIAKIKGGPL